MLVSHPLNSQSVQSAFLTNCSSETASETPAEQSLYRLYTGQQVEEGLGPPCFGSPRESDILQVQKPNM